MQLEQSHPNRTNLADELRFPTLVRTIALPKEKPTQHGKSSTVSANEARLKPGLY